MKRLFILASAAIVALASCSKTQVVYNDAPEEIGFKTVTGVMTKGEVDLAEESMGVFANYSPANGLYTPPSGVTAYDEYLDNVEFENKTSYWGGKDQSYYWPLVGNLDFVVYAPYNGTTDVVTRNYTESVNTLAINVDNIVSGLYATASQTDWHYGKTMISSPKNNDAMTVVLRHALAKISVSVSSDLAGLKVNSLTIKATRQKGTFTVDYASSSDVKWSAVASGEQVDALLIQNFIAAAGTMETSGDCYVIPSDQTSIVMEYLLPGASTPLTYTHTFTSSEWEESHHYTYDISIGVNEIKFAPKVEDWTNETTVPVSVDPNKRNN